jgi:branched-chain amino acid transport system ATP-binding protein
VSTPILIAPPLLSLHNVRAGYGTIDVLHGVDLTLEPGTVYALLGPNGAGKTTTLGVCSGQIVPSAGQVMLNGREVNGVSPDALARAGVCLVPEGRGIFPNLTVTENLRMATYAGVKLDDVLDKAFTQFPRLKERRKQVAGTMSGGEQQMLAMSRALATDPALLLLDELSMGLAPLIVEELYERVADLANAGLSILIVEQFAQAVLGVATVASIMLHGRIVRTGPPAEVAEELTAAYLGAATL